LDDVGCRKRRARGERLVASNCRSIIGEIVDVSRLHILECCEEAKNTQLRRPNLFHFPAASEWPLLDFATKMGNLILID